MTARSRSIATLLLFSGLCALVYQVAWLRELRLVFGASTPAAAAVLAVFMGGLGYGSLLLGKRAERAVRPLRLYAHLELGIAASAALTPGLLHLVRAAYVALGGSLSLGPVTGALVRLALSALVLLPPTLMMGGTLPAAARAAIAAGDEARRSTALLYGLNALGAVLGAAGSTFVLLEVFGTRLTLWLGCLLNALVGITARMLDRRLAAAEGRNAPADTHAALALDSRSPAGRPSRARRRFVLVAAAGTGFVFLLMELVWYRMLAPLLGGSSYSFGLVLAVALAGIGLGGLGYTLRGAGRPARLGGFALSCGLEALLLALPYALGDRVAWLALMLRPLGSVGLWGHVIGWTAVTSLVVLPAALVAGYQFPLLIALLGRGGAGLGREVGLAYACNTAGSIAGSLAGGFAALPVLGALGTWRLTVWVLGLLGLGAALLALTDAGARRRALLVPALAAALAVAPVHLALGPTALWRHTPIGAGRADRHLWGATRTSMRQLAHQRNRAIGWEVDGLESSIGLDTLHDSAFFMNGKSDGAAMADGGTQVMSGLLGALLHPGRVERVLVIGLGTGSTAGWLGRLPTVERVDVVELEPAMVHVARACAAVNADVLDNPKVHLYVGDAREVLLTTPHDYDLVFAEASNPYRAGVASLFTEEFYRAARARLRPGGLLAQWMQGYEVDARSIRIVYATLGAVFPAVESWFTKPGDLLLISREEDVPIDYAELARRIAEPPFAEALRSVWRVRSVEGVLAHFVARSSLARAIAAAEGPLGVNSDDRNQLEFSLARALGREQDFSVPAVQLAAHERGESRPLLTPGSSERVDWTAVYDAMTEAPMVDLAAPQLPPFVSPSNAMKQRLAALLAWHEDDADRAVTEWEAQPRPPTSPIEVMVLADGYAERGDFVQAEPLLATLRASSPVEADAVAAKLAWNMGKPTEAWRHLRQMLVGLRTDPWPNGRLVGGIMPLAVEIVRSRPGRYAEAMEVLSWPLAVQRLRHLRERLRVDISVAHDEPGCVVAFAELGPWLPWEEGLLRQRVRCYELAGDPGLAQARTDLATLLADAGMQFDVGIRPAAPLPKVRSVPPRK